MSNDIRLSQFRLMAETGLSAAELTSMSMKDYARATGRKTPTEAALDALDAAYAAQQPPATDTVSAPEAAQANAGQVQGLDPDSPEFFHLWRANRARGGEGKGIFDSATRDDLVKGAAKGYGRTGLSNENVTMPPRVGRVFVNENAQPVQGRAQFYR